MRLIPGKTKVKVELFKGVGIGDLIIGGLALLLIILLLTSSLPGKLYICLGLLFFAVVLLVRFDTEPNYKYLAHVLRHFGYRRSFRRTAEERELAPVPDDGEQAEQPEPETKEERKARRKAEKAERKADDKILKSKKSTKEEKDAIWLKRAQQSAAKKKAGKRKFKGAPMEEIIGFTGIKDDLIEYGGRYYGAVIEIPPVEFRFFSASRRNHTIENGLGRVLRSVTGEYSVNIVKLERPVLYDEYLKNEYKKLDELRSSFEKGFITEEEMKSRVEVLYDRINELNTFCFEQKVVQPFYYLVLFDSDRQQLAVSLSSAMENLSSAEMRPRRLNSRELAVFLKYTNQLDFDERDVEYVKPEDYARWAMPRTVCVKPRTTVINDIVTHNLRVVNYPASVDDAWMATVMSLPATKVVMKCTPMDRNKSVRIIDHSLQELRAQWNATGVDSKRMELQEHIQTLEGLLATLQGDNETLMEVNIYITAYDIAATRLNTAAPQPPVSGLATISNMKRTLRRLYSEHGMRLNFMEFDQVNAYIGAQVNAWDPLRGNGRGIPSNSIAAAYPWVFAHVADPNGIKLGSEGGVPVFIDFFRRDSERVNSNMVIVGKSGSGKSYATKSLLTNLAADDSKIFILDPENEYSELANNLHGKFINVGNARYGRLNPFHIITALDDDESGGAGASGSYATHLQFLEEFFRQILPDCEKDAMEYLNSIIDRMYTNKGITAESDLSALRPEDYPVFDDLYDTILTEFQSTDNEYIRSMLRTLMNYIAKFSAGGRNANIWNGPSTVTTDENFTVFNFQSLLANRNGTIANAQMLLVLKYIDNEIIKNRDYNTKYGLKRKVVVVIDEAHVFIDTKFPIALDFMFQLAKRIRKYNGMQIVITQNIKDFVGSEEIARKSTAIINACQYSFIFSLAPNDMGDLCTLYEKAGGINENEQEQIVSAPRGQAFTIMSPQSRSTFRVEVPEDVVNMFQQQTYQTRYFAGEDGAANWEDFVQDSREKRVVLHPAKKARSENGPEQQESRKFLTFEEVTEEELAEAARCEKKKETPAVHFGKITDTDDDIPEIPEDPAEFARMRAARQPAPAAPSIVVQTPAPAAPNIVVQAQAASGETERMLGELLGRFSYDAMQEQIRRSVRDLLEGEFASRLPAQNAAQPGQPAQEQSLGTVFNEDAVREAEKLRQEEKPQTDAEKKSEESEEKKGSFDLMALLAAEAARMSEISPIDMMVSYDEEVIDVTLEELAAYNAKH